MLMRAISMVPAAMMLVTSTQTVASAEEGYESRPYYGGGNKYGDYGGGSKYGGKYDYKVLKPFPKYANKFYGGKYYGDYGYECGTNYPQYKWYKPGSWKFSKYSKNNYYVDCNLPDEKADDEEKRDVHTPCFFERFVDWYESPVSSVMTDLVHDVDADAPISSARELLNKYNFTGIPVTEHHLGADGSYHAASPNQSVQGGDGRLVVGIISKKDLPADADDTFYQTHLCRSIMTSPAIIVPSDGSIEDAAKIMLEHRICRVPVIDPTNNHLVGVVSRSDVFIEPLADTD